jgi:hypothetical protein
MTKRILLAAPRSFCAGVARRRLAPVGETSFTPRAPFFQARLGARGAQVAALTEESNRGNLTVSPDAPSLAGAREVGR